MSWKNIKSIKDPRDVEFNKWWKNGGDHSYGELDVVNEDRARKAFYFCIENFNETFQIFFKEWLKNEDIRKPFKDYRGLDDSVNKLKCEEAFLAAIECIITSHDGSKHNDYKSKI